MNLTFEDWERLDALTREAKKITSLDNLHCPSLPPETRFWDEPTGRYWTAGEVDELGWMIAERL